MTIASSTKMTAEQFLMLGEDPPGIRLELANGDIVVSPSPAFDHSYTDTKLRAILVAHIEANDLGALVGDVDTIFDDLNVRRPDIIFVAKSQLPLLSKQRHGLHFPPELCIEILSPASATLDQTEKFDLYARSGVPHYWIVDPKGHTFEAYKLAAKKYACVTSGREKEIIKAPPFPSLKIPLGKIWSPLS
jgi:Uma2 family endonuclease